MLFVSVRKPPGSGPFTCSCDSFVNIDVVERPSAPYTMQLFEDAPRLAVVDG